MTKETGHLTKKNIHRLGSLRRVLHWSPENMADFALALLRSQLPYNWYLRHDAYQRYGQDVLLEIADEAVPIERTCAWIQLHVVGRIQWTAMGYALPGSVAPPPASYKRQNTGPVLKVLVDLGREELYVLSNDHYLKTHFAEYLRTGQLCWHFNRQEDLLTGRNVTAIVGRYLQLAQEQQELENLMTVLFANLDEDLSYNLPKDQLIRLLQTLRTLLHHDLAYWSFTQPSVYYYLHGLLVRTQEKSGV